MGMQFFLFFQDFKVISTPSVGLRLTTPRSRVAQSIDSASQVPWGGGWGGRGQLFELVFSFSSAKYTEVELWDHMVALSLIF